MLSLFEHQIHRNIIYISISRYSIHINIISSIGLWKQFYSLMPWHWTTFHMRNKPMTFAKVTMLV